jgi:hypothetical protein
MGEALVARATETDCIFFPDKLASDGTLGHILTRSY